MAKSRRSLLLALLPALLVLTAAAANAADFYVAANASSSGTGTIGSPWKLQTALDQPSAVHPGDTIWVRGGTYVGHFTSYLNGSSANPIQVRAYTGERAKIDGHLDSTNAPAITVNGSYTWFWGLEVMNSGTNRTTSGTLDIPPPGKGPGFYVGGPGTRIINCIVHDNSEGLDIWEAATDAEVTGNLSYFNGWDDVQTRGSGHGLYTQNNTGTKHYFDNILFDGFSYGIHAYAEGGHLNNLDFEGNISFNNGSLSQVSGYAANLLLGGLTVAHNPKLISNYTYFPSGGKWDNLGYSAGCQNAAVTNNYFAGGEAFKLVACSGVSMTGNTFAGPVYGFGNGQYPSNTYISGNPTGLKVFVRANPYEAGRANIAVYNWDLQSTVSVDVSGILSAGQGFEVRNAQDFYGAPVLTGTYSGSPLVLPMTGLSVASPVGWGAPPRTGPEFNAFVLLPASAGGSPTATPTKTKTPVPPTPTKTKTPAPATPTKTKTPAPATPTKTKTPVPATPTKTKTPVPPTPSRTPTRTPTKTPTPGGTLTTLRVEAEAMARVSPMTTGASTAAFNGQYIYTATAESGSATWTVNIPTAGTWAFWCRVLAPTWTQDSVYVSVDGGPEDVYDVAEGTWSSAWQWTKVNGRNGGAPLTLNPRTFSLSAGTHTIKLRGREPQTKIDRVIATNDMSFVPTEVP